MKKQKNNTGTAVSLTPKFNSRRVISTILAVIFMVSMLTVTCFATGTGGTGGGTDNITVEFKASELEKELITTDRRELKEIVDRVRKQVDHNTLIIDL